MAENVMIPLRQANIVVVGLTLVVVLFSDGETGFAFPPFCAALDLDDSDQAHRLRKHPVLSAALVLAQVELAGKLQVANVLLTWGVPLWLGSLRTGRRTPEYQMRIEALQREVGRAAAQQFSRVEPAPAGPEVPVPPLTPPAIQSGAPPHPAWEWLLAALDETSAALNETKRALVALRQEEQAERARLEQRLLEQEQRVADLREWFISLDQRVATLGQRQQEPALSATHLADLMAIFRDLEQATGRAQAQLEQELTTLFKVEAITAIPDAFWPEVLAWYAWSARQP